jgi:hypothetical protein
VTLSGCGGVGLACISQLADVPGRQSRAGGRVEIRIVLDREPLELALTCQDAAAAAARQGNEERARQLLDQAVTIYERLDATRDLARADAALRRMGVRRGRHVTHRRAQTGWQSLTPSEGPWLNWSPRD